MMKNRSNYVFILLFSTLLLAIICVFNDFSYGIIEYPFRIEIVESNIDKRIELYYDGSSYWAFLPSYSNKSNTVFIKNTSKKVYLDSELVEDELFLEEGTYQIIYDDENYKLIVKKSENIPTMYIDTKKNAISRLYSNKDENERTSILVCDELGKINYYSINYNDKISGRGNSTWKQEKKPFNINLEKETNLLDMAASKKWALLANAYDSSNIRDKLYKELAKELQLKYTPDSTYIDLYINGEYNGLYLLSEKINIDCDKTNDFNNLLATFEYWQRSDDLNNLFNTDLYDVTVNVEYPIELNNNQLFTVKELLNELERAMSSDDGIDYISGKKLSEIIDIDSWARFYLLDEVTKNLDCNIASSYFYIGKDNKLYKGPSWDGDRTLGSDLRNNNPNGFFADRVYKSINNYNPYNKMLMQNDEFKTKLFELYYSNFNNVIDSYINKKIDIIANQINKASIMNSIRWQNMFDDLIVIQGQEYISHNEIKQYLLKRKQFLDENLLKYDDFCSIYIELNDGSYYIDSIEKGNVYKIPNFDNLSNNKLVNKETGNNINSEEIIEKDTVIVTLKEEIKEEDSIFKIILNNSKIITGVATFFILLCILFILIVRDIKNGK